jgi:hypothetical protein
MSRPGDGFAVRVGAEAAISQQLVIELWTALSGDAEGESFG